MILHSDDNAGQPQMNHHEEVRGDGDVYHDQVSRLSNYSYVQPFCQTDIGQPAAPA